MIIDLTNKRLIFLQITLVLSFILFTHRAFAQDTTDGIIWYPAIQLSDSSHNAGQPRIALSGDDTVHVTWWQDPPYGFRLPYRRSVSSGKEFEPTKDLITDTVNYPYLAFRPFIIARSQIVWIFFTGATASLPPIYMIKSSDTGTSWSQPIDITTDHTSEVSHASLSRDSIAIVYPPVSEHRKLLRSTNDGATWTRTNEDLDDYAKIALTPNKLHLVQHTTRNNAAEVEYRRSSNLGDTWEIDTVISDVDEYYSDLPTIAGYTSECGTELLAAWRDTKYEWFCVYGASIISRSSVLGGSSWLPEIVMTPEPKYSEPVASIKGNARAIVTMYELSCDTLHTAVATSNTSLSSFSKPFDVTVNARKALDATGVVSTRAIHLVWEQEVGSTFRIFYRRGEFIQKNVNFSLSKSFLEMDTTEIGRTTPDTVGVMNTGSDTMTVGTAISNNDNFSVTPQDTTIPPFGDVLFTINFSPKQCGQTSGKIIFYHNGQTSPDCFDVNGTAIWRREKISYQQDQWNMISIPMKPGFAQSLPSMFSYEGSYVPRDTVEFGKGYWSKPAGEVTYYGTYVWSDTFVVRIGWNMIGSLTGDVFRDSIRTLPDSIITSPFYIYSGSQYVIADTIKPGRGYWVKMKRDGKIVLKSK